MMALRIVQENCQRSCAVINDLSAMLLREGVNVAVSRCYNQFRRSRV